MAAAVVTKGEWVDLTPTPTLGAWVNTRPMSSAKKDADAPSVLLYFEETGWRTGPLWIEGYWMDNGALSVGWMTPFGFLGDPVAWAPLPKTGPDMS